MSTGRSSIRREKPIGLAERSILIDSLGIMLAIVIPTIVATFAFAWWFRASNTKLDILPDFVYSGRIEHDHMVHPLLKSSSWGRGLIGSHDLDPAKAAAIEDSAARSPGRSLDWKWLFMLPGAARASVNQLVVPPACLFTSP